MDFRMDELDDLTDDEDFLELVKLVAFRRKPRTFRNKIDHFEKWDDIEFRERFRLSKNTVRHILEEINNDLVCHENMNSALTPSVMLLSTLRYLATGNILRVVRDFGGFNKAIANEVISKVARVIAQRCSQIVKMPQSAEELQDTKKKFYNISRFPNCIGAIGCTHIKIQSPGGDDVEVFRNRKNVFSLNVQVVSDSDLKIMDIVCRWPGSVHGATIFNNSRLKARLESKEFQNNVLVGDGKYKIKNYLLTPLTKPVTKGEQLYNESQKRTRNCVERLIGALKKRFPILESGINMKIETVQAVIVACAVLHNIALERGEPDLEIDENADLPEDIDLKKNDFYRNYLTSNYFETLQDY